MGSCGYRKDWILIAGRSKQVADNVGGTLVFLALPLKVTLAAGKQPPPDVYVQIYHTSEANWRGIVEGSKKVPLQ